MESVLRMIGRAGRTAETVEHPPTDCGELLEEVQRVNRMIRYNSLWFQAECDEDLLEACVYQREELLARYRYLLKAVRARGLTAEPFPK